MIDFTTLAWQSVPATNYITVDSSFTVNALSAKKFGPIVCIQYDVSGTFAEGQTVIGTGVSGAFTEAFYGAARTTSGTSAKPASVVAIPNGQLRVHASMASTGSAGTLWLMTD